MKQILESIGGSLTHPLRTFSFLAELLSALWLEILPGWNLVADDVQTTCGRCADDPRTTCGRHESETSLEISGGGWHMSSGRRPHVVRTSFAGRYVIYMLFAHAHVIRTSSASHPHRSSWSVWAWTIFYCDRNLLFDGICGRNVELFHFRIM